MQDPRALEERDLVARCLAGDRGAWESFVRRYLSTLTLQIRMSLRRFGAADPPAAIDEMLQEVFTALLENDRSALRRFRWDCPLEKYLSAVAAIRVAHVLGRAKPLATMDPDHLPDEDESPERAVEAVAESRRMAVGPALERLLPREQLALKLHYWEGLSSEAIGKLLSMSPVAVRMMLSRARRRLKEFLRGMSCL